MSDRELRDQLVTLLLAGHETTATGLAWTFDLLLRHPAALARLTAEVDAGEDRISARGDLRSRCGCARSCRSRDGAWPPTSNAGGLTFRPGPTSRQRSGSRTPALISTRSRSRSDPSASSDVRAQWLRMDPVRRWHPALPGGELRRNGDAGGARDSLAPQRFGVRRAHVRNGSPAATSRSRRATERSCTVGRAALPCWPPSLCSSRRRSSQPAILRRSPGLSKASARPLRSSAWPGARAPCRRRPRAERSSAA